MAQLGVNTNIGARRDPTGKEVPNTYNPTLRKVTQLNKRSEIFAGGIGWEAGSWPDKDKHNAASYREAGPGPPARGGIVAPAACLEEDRSSAAGCTIRDRGLAGGFWPSDHVPVKLAVNVSVSLRPLRTHRQMRMWSRLVAADQSQGGVGGLTPRPRRRLWRR